MHPITKKKQFHSGVDLKANFVPVSAVLAGEVKLIGEDAFIGKYLVLSHGRLESVYGHLSQVVVVKGTKVDPGQTIAISGNSGRSTGAHLHFSLKLAGRYIAPFSALRALFNTIQTQIMQNDSIKETDLLSLPAILLLLSTQQQISLSPQQSQAYGVEVADELPETEGEEDGN